MKIFKCIKYLQNICSYVQEIYIKHAKIWTVYAKICNETCKIWISPCWHNFTLHALPTLLMTSSWPVLRPSRAPNSRPSGNLTLWITFGFLDIYRISMDNFLRKDILEISHRYDQGYPNFKKLDLGYPTSKQFVIRYLTFMNSRQIIVLGISWHKSRHIYGISFHNYFVSPVSFLASLCCSLWSLVPPFGTGGILTPRPFLHHSYLLHLSLRLWQTPR